MNDRERLSGGELNAALTREVVRIHTASLGRGPTKSFSLHHGNIVMTVMHEAMTPAERSLTAKGEGEAVLLMRRRLQDTMADELSEAIESLTERSVVAFMSDNHLDPDMSVEVFILDAPTEGAAQPVRPAASG